MRTQIIDPIVYKRIPKRNTKQDSRAKYILRWAKKIKAINYKGGQCLICGEKRIWVLVFHHNSNIKDDSITNMITKTCRWSEIQEELDKCDLVCENCHREIHANISSENKRTKSNKLICLEFKKQLRCNKCNYSKCNWALEFHHKSDKVLGIAKYIGKHSWKSIADIQECVMAELDKCDVYCSNCHREEHFDVKKFLMLQSEIIEKSNNLSEKRILIDKLAVLDSIKCLLGEGLERRQIFKKVSTDFNCSYFRVYEIAKEYGIGGHSVDHEEVLNLWFTGKSRKEIMNETGYSKSSVIKILKGLKKQT